MIDNNIFYIGNEDYMKKIIGEGFDQTFSKSLGG